MADEVRPGQDPAQDQPEPHLPSPTIGPAGFAAGIALVLLGLVAGYWSVVAVGAGLALVFGFLWVRDVTADVRAAPAPPVERPARTRRGAPVIEEPYEVTPRYTRARFLEGSTLGLGALIGGIVTVPAIGFAVAPAFVGQADKDVNLGPLTDYPEGQWFVATFESNEAQGTVSRRTAFIRNNGLANGVPSFTIISNRCAHVGCPVQPQGPLDEKQKKEIEGGKVTLIPTQPSGFGCPCHGGAYDSEGNRIQGPPVRALDRYEYLIKNGNLVLGKRISVGKVIGTGKNAKIQAYKRMDPGQHVDGREQYFYPLTP